MTLLELDGVGKVYRRGLRVALDDVSFEIDIGEMVVVWGPRRSGRSTLLRIAAGIETPDVGVVRFDGHDLARCGTRMLGEEIGYCRPTFRRDRGQTVLEQLVAGSLARGLSQPVALANAWRALERAGVEACAECSVGELKAGEAVRVAIARALTAQPRLIVIDEPTLGVDLLERDGVLELLRALTEHGIAILASTGEGTGLVGAHRVLALEKGKLHGQLAPKLASVTDLGELSRLRHARG
jgi:ABC-type cobalamin/Fe3+-siderophores transport system ATPase subunit